MSRYLKPHLSILQQEALLRRRGMRLDDASCVFALGQIGYHRLSGYWYPYRVIDQAASSRHGRPVRTADVGPGTDLNQVLRVYEFDRRLKLLTMDAIERIEVAIRVKVTDVLGRRGPFAHLDPGHLETRFSTSGQGRPSRHASWVGKLRAHQARSSEEYVAHYGRKYGGDLPIWAALEVLDFGALSVLFQGLKRRDRDEIARRLDVVDRTGAGDGAVLANWLRTLNIARNTCAHHARLWNRHFTDTVRVSALQGIKGLKHLAGLEHRDRARFYPALMVLCFLMEKVSMDGDWKAELVRLLSDFPADGVVSLADMGFPAEWADLMS
ncbi:Abi family protein [Promicromonospora sp. MEB111]|uniref:Abi family protein n=1 Tax=Promicromonospora sp. MEB111 TaxID=3040301 RepID=UPI00254C1C25|nr:Abi family protein [Promicromonospora sp. MEB111]